MTYFIKISIGIILIICSFYIPDELRPEIMGAGIMALVGVTFFDFTPFAFKNWSRFLLIIRCKILSFKREYIRFSMSYQYRIKIEDKYLLVKNSNWGFYQHVGGKYKRNAYSQKIIKDFEGKDDLKLQTTGKKKDDFAIYIPAKNAIKFLDWFNTRRDREISHWREFCEELLCGETKVLTKRNFPYVNYNFAGSVLTPLKKSPNLKCWEILQYDVLDLIPTQEQEKELLKLLEKGDNDYVKWADNQLIQNGGHDDRQKKTLYDIGVHTKWIVNLKWSKV